MNIADSPLVQHAEDEMSRAGLYDADADYDGMIPEAVMRVVKAFAEDGHSGTSADITIAILERVLRFKALVPITSDPSEWRDVSEMSGTPLWQSNRVPHIFSDDGGQTWYSIEPSLAEVGDRVRDGGEMGVIVRCHECGGSGQLHRPDEIPPVVEPDG